jgi:hypothetical protein
VYLGLVKQKRGVLRVLAPLSGFIIERLEARLREVVASHDVAIVHVNNPVLTKPARHQRSLYDLFSLNSSAFYNNHVRLRH